MTLPAIVLENVRKSPLFAGLTEKEADSLLLSGQLYSLPRGRVVFHQGDAITHFYLIAGGIIQLYRGTVDGHAKTLDIITVGQPFCESEVINSYSHHRASAIAVNDSLILKFPIHWVRETAKRQSDFALNLLAIVSQQAHLAELEAEHQARMSATQLVACFFQWLCKLYDLDYQNFTLPYSKTLIASRLGMDLATFSRALGRLKSQHLSICGARVAIHDIERIGKYACGGCSFAENCPAHWSLKGKNGSAYFHDHFLQQPDKTKTL